MKILFLLVFYLSVLFSVSAIPLDPTLMAICGAVLAAIVTYLVYKPKIKFVKPDYQYCILSALSLFTINTIIGILLQTDSSHSVSVLSSYSGAFSILVCLIYPVIIAPICEELVFRKILHPLCETNFQFYIISACIFACLHIGPVSLGANIRTVITASISSVFFCRAYLKKSLVDSILVHSLSNMPAAIILTVLTFSV